MPLSGKYSFPGIQKAGAAGLKLALASTTWGAWIVKWLPLDPILEFFSNWLANKGLIVMNLGAILINGELDQAAFDKAIQDGLDKVELGRGQITPEQGKAIDDAVIAAANKYISFNP
jgi:hypothetical protein